MLYAGYQYDAETGLYYLNARMYDSKTARFIQEDTYRGNKTDPLSLNLYTYCANNPLKYEDPTGHNFIKSALSKGAKAVKKVAKKAVKAVKKVAKAAKTVAKKVVSAVKYVVKTVVKYVTKAVKYVANKVQQFWNSPGETVQSVISDAQRALEERRKAVEAKIQAYQQSDTMKFALTATAVDNSMDASEKGGILDMLGDFVDAKLNDLSGLAGNAIDFVSNNKSFMVHSTLDVLGLLPGIGNFADGLNAVVYLLEGDMTNVAWSLAACLPLAGIATVGVKYTGKAADATITFFKNSDKLNGFLDTGKTALKKTGDFFGDFFAGVKRVLNDNGGYMDLDAILHPVKAHKALKAKRSGRTFVSEYEIPINDEGFTKSTLKLGQEVHKEYKATDVDNITKFKEYVLPSGKRVDYIDFESKTVYELKPHNPNQIRRGNKQLQNYLNEIEEEFGDGWTSTLDTY